MAEEQRGGAERGGVSEGGRRDSGSGSDIDIDVDVDESVDLDGSGLEEGEIPSTPTWQTSAQPSTSSSSAFRPYVSVLDTITTPDRSHSAKRARLTRSPTSPSAPTRPSKRLPPWRSALGRAYYALGCDPSLDAPSTDFFTHIAPGEEAAYHALLERAYANFSDVPVGSDIPIEDPDDTPDIVVDNEPKRFTFPGEVISTYDTLTAPPATTPSGRGRSQAVHIDRTCWNCGGDDHNMPDCPRPRDHRRVDQARREFMLQREVARMTMPEWHRPYLDAYVCDPEDRKRRLKRATQLRPNDPSRALLDAVYYVEPSDPDEVVDRYDLTPEQYRRFEDEAYINVKRKREEMPWFEGMMRWGYPPGWIAARDPIDEAKRRIRIDPLTEEVESDSDEEDLLEVFGGLGATPSPDADPRATSPPSPPPPPPPEPDTAPPPPPASNHPYRKWWELPPPSRHAPLPRARRWVAYKTDLFDWQRLHPYDPVRPMPMPLPMRF